MDDMLSSSDLIRIVELVSRLSAQLGGGFAETIGHLERLAAGADVARAPRPVAAFAERVRAARLKRNEAMRADIFRDPGWDMMLDLYVCGVQQRPCSTSALCVGSGAPTTTALRYLDRLEAAGLIVRRSDRRDHRRTLVELAPHVEVRFAQLLARIQDCY